MRAEYCVIASPLYGLTLPLQCPRLWGESVLVMPLVGAGSKLRGCEPVQARVRSECVVVNPPFFDDLSGFWQAGEEVLIEALVAQPAVEAFDESVLGRLAGSDVMPFHAPFFLPGQDGAGGQLGTVAHWEGACSQAGRP